MKRKVMLIVGMLAIGFVGFSQAVKDRQVIPVSVNLNQVLRMTILNGGNIEFVFNSIDDYRLGLSGDPVTSGSANPATLENFYITDFTVASSTRWHLNYGSEEATFIGTDDPGNTLALTNVGFTLSNTAAAGHDFEGAANAQGTTADAELWSAPTLNGTEVVAISPYPEMLIDDNGAASANAGDADDNTFQIIWRCGTGEDAGTFLPMETESILNQDPSPAPDRYVTNVLFELGVD